MVERIKEMIFDLELVEQGNMIFINGKNDKGETIGTLEAEIMSADQIDLDDVKVQLSARRQGLMTQMITALEVYCVENKIEWIELDAVPTREPKSPSKAELKAAYERLGFERSGGYRMCKQISQAIEGVMAA